MDNSRAERIVLRVATFVLKAWFRTLEYRTAGECLRSSIVSFWHSGIFPVVGMIYRKGSSADYTSLVSQSPDGRRLGFLLQQLGFKVVFGSSSAGGFTSALEVARILKSKRSVLITPDGPKGPVDIVKDGAMGLSAQTDSPIQPVSVVCEKAWRLRTWDCAVLPKPWSIVRITFEKPVMITISRDDDEWEVVKDELRRAMHGVKADRSVEIAHS